MCWEIILSIICAILIWGKTSEQEQYHNNIIWWYYWHQQSRHQQYQWPISINPACIKYQTFLTCLMGIHIFSQCAFTSQSPAISSWYIAMWLNFTSYFRWDQQLIIDSFGPGDAYMCQWIGSSLGKLIACCLLGIKPLPGSILIIADGTVVNII